MDQFKKWQHRLNHFWGSTEKFDTTHGGSWGGGGCMGTSVGPWTTSLRQSPQHYPHRLHSPLRERSLPKRIQQSNCNSSVTTTQFSQEWARRKVVVKHSIQSNPQLPPSHYPKRWTGSDPSASGLHRLTSQTPLPPPVARVPAVR